MGVVIVVVVYIAVLLVGVQTDAHTVVVLAQIAHGLQGAVAAHRCKGLEEVEQLLRLHQEAHAARGLLGIYVEAEEQGLKHQLLVFLCVGPLAADGLAVYLAADSCFTYFTVKASNLSD